MSHPIHLSRRVAAIVATVALGGMLALGGAVPAHASDNYPGARAASDNYPGHCPAPVSGHHHHRGPVAGHR